jgi:flagellar hook-associated protein FlgK
MWIGEAENNKVPADKRQKLLDQRASLVKELEEMVKAQAAKPPSKSEAGKHWDMQDRKELATKILAIDKKLGRTT